VPTVVNGMQRRRGEQTRRLPVGEDNLLAQWSPDGGTIYHKAFDAAGSSSVWSIPAAGGAPGLLVRFDDPARPSSRPEFATDGKRFISAPARATSRRCSSGLAERWRRKI
jgi:hypothetical protein